MSQQVTFANTAKSAFRINVRGTEPNDIVSILLTGDGDERDLTLSVGSYAVDVLNIGSGESYTYQFKVDSAPAHTVQKIGPEKQTNAPWRSLQARDESLPITNRWIDAAGSIVSKDASIKLRMRSNVGASWRKFTGMRMINSGRPEAIKIVRPKAWSDSPFVRLDYIDRSKRRAHCNIPLFSRGTLVEWGQEDNHLVSMAPCDPKSEAIIGSLSNSMRDEVLQIVRWASGVEDEEEAVREITRSREDPWTAAAVGLLLVGSGQSKRIGAYASRLAQRHPWMADAGVLAAWWTAANSPKEEKGCLEQLTNAREHGQIYFWNSFSLGEQLLSVLGSGAASTVLRSQARKELGRWKRMRSGTVKVGAFPVWIEAS